MLDEYTRPLPPTVTRIVRKCYSSRESYWSGDADLRAHRFKYAFTVGRRHSGGTVFCGGTMSQKIDRRAVA